MKAMHRRLWITMAVSLAPVLAGAGEAAAGGGTSGAALQAAAEPSVNAGTLGKVEGLLDFCAKVTGRLPTKDGVGAGRMLGATSEQLVAEARQSDEYRDGYDAITADLDQVPVDQARKACSDLPRTAEPSRRPAGHRG